MSKRRQEDAAVVDDQPAIEPPVDPFEDLSIDNLPMLRLAVDTLRPFVRHGTECSRETCACGLTAAVSGLGARAERLKRYGTE